MTASNLITKTMLASYKESELTQPKMFLQSFFGKNQTELRISDALTVEVDIIRDANLVAVDVVRGGDGNSNTVNRYSTKEYQPPLYNEKTAITGSMLAKRLPGVNPFDGALTSREYAFMVLAAEAQAKQINKIKRAIEKQASEALFSGTITLSNTESLDFKRKATHNVTPGVQWTASAGQPITDIASACDIAKEDGKLAPDMAIFGSTAWTNFVSNTNVQNYLDKRLIEPGLIKPVAAAENAVYQGRVYFMSYALDLYTYPEFYEDPAGTHYPYCPAKQVVVMNSQARLDKAFGAVDVLPELQAEYTNLGLVGPELMEGMFIPYHYVMPPSSAYIGVQSAPLIIPTAIDTIVNINAVA